LAINNIKEVAEVNELGEFIMPRMDWNIL